MFCAAALFCGIAAPLAAEKAPEALAPQTEAQFAASILEQLQAPSFAKEVEFCGYIGRDDAGNLVATRPRRGDVAGCDMPLWPRTMRVVASYHTHGDFNLDYNSEFPSVQDMETDEASGIDGYISTPGGRLWFVDTTEMVASMICGLNCLPQDPDFRDLDGPLALSYSYEELLRREQ